MRKTITLICILARCVTLVAVVGVAVSPAAASKPATKKTPAVKKTQPAKKTTAAMAVAKKTVIKQTVVKKLPQPAKNPPKPASAAVKATSSAVGQAGSGPPAGGLEAVKLADVKVDAVAPDVCTSLVVDATGMKLDKCMSPKVVREDGTVVWGTFAKLTDEQYSILQERGMAAYVVTVEEARSNARAGSKPLVLRALGSTGKGLKSDLVISDIDAEALLAENAKGRFLDAFNVILVRNENPPVLDNPAAVVPDDGESTEPQQ